jgi:thioredoxin reductase
MSSCSTAAKAGPTSYRKVTTTPGFAQGISGRKLLALLKEQAHACGVAMVGSRVTSLSRRDAGFVG